MHWFWRAAIALVVGTVAGIGCYAIQDFMLPPQSIRPAGVRPWYMLVAACSSVTALVVFIKLVPARLAEPDCSETRCRKCDYILRGISEPRCPECGERI